MVVGIRKGSEPSRRNTGRLGERCGPVSVSMRSHVVGSMPRRPAKMAQVELAHAIRAANEAGAVEVVIDGEGQIRVVLSSGEPMVSPSPQKDEGHVWTMSVPGKKKRWSSRDSASWRDIPKHQLRR